MKVFLDAPISLAPVVYRTLQDYNESLLDAPRCVQTWLLFCILTAQQAFLGLVALMQSRFSITVPSLFAATAAAAQVTQQMRHPGSGHPVAPLEARIGHLLQP